MQKFLAAIFIGVFLLSGSIGFGIVRQVKSLSGKNGPAVVAPSNQVNILLVRVDDEAQARLISVWGLFISRSERPSVIMKRLYPEPGSETSLKINASFSLDENKQPSQKFLDTLNGLGLPSLKIAVADDTLAVDWLNGLVDQSDFDPSMVRTSAESLEAAQKIDRQLFSSACSTIQKPDSSISLVSSDTPLEPKSSPSIHFSENFRGWEGLVTSLHLSSCKMLVSP